MLNTIEIWGLKKDTQQYNFGSDLAKPKIIIETENGIILARPNDKGFDGSESQDSKICLTREEEIVRRLSSIKMYQKYLPLYTPQTQLVLLQSGRTNQSNTNKPILAPYLGRYMRRLEKVTPISEIKGAEILRNKKLCKSLAEVNLGFLKLLLNENIIADSGEHGKLGRNFAGPLFFLSRRLTSDNIMIGQESNGEQKIFCDPDWYTKLEENPHPNIRKLKRFSILVLKILIFKAASRL